MNQTTRPSIWLPTILAVLALLAAGTAIILSTQTTSKPETNIPTYPPSPTPSPVPNGAMWSIGTGGDGQNPYVEWVAVYPVSTLWNILGAPSLRFTDHAPDTPDNVRSFEIGFYKYGPTWYTENHIVEFWLGDGSGGILSVMGNEDGGAEFQVRNPSDTGSISLSYMNPSHPVIGVDHPDNPLYLRAEKGLVSESKHTFQQGITVPTQSGYAGQITDGDWTDGSLVVETTAIAAESLVLITPISEPEGRWWVGDLVPGESFTVHSTADDENMAFNWLIVN